LGAFRERLFEPVDIASIAIFRMMFGAVIFWEVWRYFDYGWISSYYMVPNFYFKYYGFEWVHPWLGNGMYIHFVVIASCALCVMAGFLYRFTSWLLFFCLAYWFLLDQSRYLNHFYLIVLIAFLMAAIPAHRANSLDTRRQPKLYSNTIPAWCLWLLRTQVGIVYFYGGLAKLNADWLRGDPPRQWLAAHDHYPLIGSWISSETAVWIMSYGGLLFDLGVVPALLWSKTRPWAFAACVGFHLMNASLFSIGVFPFLMLAATLLLFPPDWPRKACLLFTSIRDDSNQITPPVPISKLRKRLIETSLAAYILIQALLPLRHFLYPGSVHWTEEGQRFAWHMMVHHKRANVRFHVRDLSAGKDWEEDHREYLSASQSRNIGDKPDLCLQFAHYLAAEMKKKGYQRIAIHAQANAELNNREFQRLIDIAVDLSNEPRNLWHADWIIPLEKRSKAPSK